MTLLDNITVLILTYNEEENIERTLESLKWAKHILVVDSGSCDGTLGIIARHPQARVVTKSFDGFASQCNFGLTQIDTSWVLSIDADYQLSKPLADEIERLSPEDGVAGFRASFVFCVCGHSIGSTLYPPRTVLYRRDKARYREEGHGHRVVIDGVIQKLQGRIYHDDRKPLARWLESQQRYAKAEVDFLMSSPKAELGLVDRIRRLGWLAPFLIFLYALIWKRCLTKGRAGWLYVLQRTLVEIMIAIQVVDRLIRRLPSQQRNNSRRGS